MTHSLLSVVHLKNCRVKSFDVSTPLSVSTHIYQNGSQWKNFLEIWYWHFNENPSIKSKFGENLTKILDTLHEICLLLPATLNRHESAFFESHGTASQDSRGGTNITQKRQNITLYVYYISCCTHMQSSHTQMRLSQDLCGIPQENRECIAVHATVRKRFSSDFTIA
jgi:hypothetical protein